VQVDAADASVSQGHDVDLGACGFERRDRNRELDFLETVCC
jgi:hypothetical protein